jgi:IS5 family transposase
MTENRHGLVVTAAVGEANGTSEREFALKTVRHVRRRHRMKIATLGADAGYDAAEFLQALERAQDTPHIALRNMNAMIKHAKRIKAIACGHLNRERFHNAILFHRGELDLYARGGASTHTES